jgi:hypothetical protein
VQLGERRRGERRGEKVGESERGERVCGVRSEEREKERDKVVSIDFLRRG